MQLRPLGQSQGASALIYWIIPLGGDEKQDLIPREMPAEKIISLPASPLLFFFLFIFFSETSLSSCRLYSLATTLHHQRFPEPAYPI